MRKSNYARSAVLDGVTAVAALLAFSYGLAAYVAPNKFLAPQIDTNALSPFLKTSLPSNDLDPITQYFLRCQGISTLALIASYYLFAWGDLESERSFSRAFLVGHLSNFALAVHLFQDESTKEFYEDQALTMNVYVTALYVILWAYALFKMPRPKSKQHKSKKTQSKSVPIPPSVDTAIFYACALYITSICVSTAIFGADRKYFPRTPLPNDAFDVIMDSEARASGVWFIPGVYMLLFEGQRLPQLIYKTMILYILLTLPIMVITIRDDNTYVNRKAIASTMVSDAIFLVLAVYRLVALRKEEELFKSTHSKLEGGGIVESDEGMTLRDGRVISYRAQ